MYFYLFWPLNMTFIGVTQGSQNTEDFPVFETLKYLSLNLVHKSIFTFSFLVWPFNVSLKLLKGNLLGPQNALNHCSESQLKSKL